MSNDLFFDNLPESFDGLLNEYVSDYKKLINHIINIKSDWEKFIAAGKTSGLKNVKPEVLSSWKRSREMGIDPHLLNPHYLAPEELSARLKKNAELVNIASPFLEVLASSLSGSGFRIDLFDRDLYILRQFGEPEVLEKAYEQGSGLGVSKAECHTGTNAINLAARLKRPVQLLGSEHYNANLQYWTCASTPLLDKNKNLLGVINVAGHFGKFHKHTLGMVIALGKAIEFSWNQNSLRKEIELVSKYNESIVQSITDGLITLDKRGMIKTINSTAARLLEINACDVIDRPADSILGENEVISEAQKTGNEFYNVELVFKCGRKRKAFIGNVLSVINNNRVDGVLAIFKDYGHARGFVKNMAGFKAYFTFDSLIGSTPGFLNAVNLARQSANLSSNILLFGESGTGKELFAQSIHNASELRDGPFVAINCGAIPMELIESDLFGYEGGAFTGAKREGQPGKFQLAKGGTLFLDEVNAMPVTTQVKLLRVLQNRVFTRVGGSYEIPFDARIIAATNCDLWEEVSQGNFREDLFFRLNVISIEIPPLRERKQDIPLLIDYFCRKHSRRMKKRLVFSEEAVDVAVQYDWPGNVRELENVIERCVAVAYSRDSYYIEKSDLLSYPGIKRSLSKESMLTGSAPAGNSGIKMLDLKEKELISQVLKNTGGNISRAARHLGIRRKTLYRKIEKYNIKVMKASYKT